jgi:ubiquitin-conjugating enzyme E2 W
MAPGKRNVAFSAAVVLAHLQPWAAGERPADVAARESSRSRSSASKIAVATMREPRRALRAHAAGVDNADGNTDSDGERTASSSVGLVALMRWLMRAVLRLCIRLLGMDALLTPAAAPLAGGGLAEEAAAGTELPAEPEDGAPAAPAAGGKSRLQAFLGTRSASQPATASTANADGAGVAAGSTAVYQTPEALRLHALGFSDRFAEAMSQRMAACDRRPVDLSTPWARHLLAQLAQLRGKDRDELVRVQPPAHLSEWVVEVTGAPGSLYEGERYKLQFQFDRSYPISPPRVKFLRPVPKHEHVYSDGKICLNILYSDWKPEMTVLGVCQSLISMMASAVEKKRPPDNAATIMSSIHQDPSKMQWIFHDDKVSRRSSAASLLRGSPRRALPAPGPARPPGGVLPGVRQP